MHNLRLSSGPLISHEHSQQQQQKQEQQAEQATKIGDGSSTILITLIRAQAREGVEKVD